MLHPGVARLILICCLFAIPIWMASSASADPLLLLFEGRPLASFSSLVEQLLGADPPEGDDPILVADLDKDRDDDTHEAASCLVRINKGFARVARAQGKVNAGNTKERANE